MTNKNQEAFEQMNRLTKAAKNFYGDNYNPGTLYPPRDTKFLLDEEYIPFDFDTDYDDTLYKEYRRVRMLDNPFEYNQPSALNQTIGAIYDLGKNYREMTNHKFKYMDDYHHCKANYEAIKRGDYGYKTAKNLMFYKELIDKPKNRYIRGLSQQETENDFIHDSYINALGRARAKFGNYKNSKDACAEFRSNNLAFPKELW